MRKDFDGNAHSKLHHDDFSRLIADARRKKNLPVSQEKVAEEQDGEKLEEVRGSVQASQPDYDASTASLPIREEDDARAQAYDPPPSSQQLGDNIHGEAFDVIAGRSSQSQRRPQGSQEFARQNHALAPGPEQVVGR